MPKGIKVDNLMGGVDFGEVEHLILFEEKVVEFVLVVDGQLIEAACCDA